MLIPNNVSDGKEVSAMLIVGPAVSRASARDWEYTRGSNRIANGVGCGRNITKSHRLCGFPNW
jgi:hypothetical protein